MVRVLRKLFAVTLVDEVLQASTNKHRAICKGRLKSAAGERGGPKVRHPDRTGGCTAIWNNGPRFVDECW